MHVTGRRGREGGSYAGAATSADLSFTCVAAKADVAEAAASQAVAAAVAVAQAVHACQEAWVAAHVIGIRALLRGCIPLLCSRTLRLDMRPPQVQMHTRNLYSTAGSTTSPARHQRTPTAQGLRHRWQGCERQCSANYRLCACMYVAQGVCGCEHGVHRAAVVPKQRRPCLSNGSVMEEAAAAARTRVAGHAVDENFACCRATHRDAVGEGLLVH